MSMIAPGEEPVGWTFKAESYSPEKIIAVLYESEPGFRELVLAGEIAYLPGTVVYRWLERSGIDIEEQYSYDSDDFPKPIYADQLACTDIDWTPLAPAHHFTPWMAPASQQTCTWCGQERPVLRDENGQTHE